MGGPLTPAPRSSVAVGFAELTESVGLQCLAQGRVGLRRCSYDGGRHPVSSEDSTLRLHPFRSLTLEDRDDAGPVLFCLKNKTKTLIIGFNAISELKCLTGSSQPFIPRGTHRG